MGVINMRGNHNGEKYSMITIIDKTYKNGRLMYIGKCECGSIKSYYLGNMRKGRTTNCGCIQYKHVNERLKKISKEGKRFILNFTNNKKRFYNQRNKKYGRYGGQSIKKCYEWFDYFMNFYNWS